MNKEQQKHPSENIDRQDIVSVKDTGVSIDHEVMLRLLTKLICKSKTGTGSGLFYRKASQGIMVGFGQETLDADVELAFFELLQPFLNGYFRWIVD
jgi:hypothetical protein